MALRWETVLLLVVLMGTGCATARMARMDTGEESSIVYTPRAAVAPVELDGKEFKDAIQKLARTAPLSSHPREAALRLFKPDDNHAYSHVRGHLGLISVKDPRRGRLLVLQGEDEDMCLARAYERWCQRQELPNDCLHLLDEGLTLDEEGKRTLAFRLALDSVWDETTKALKDLTDKDAMITQLATTGAFYFALWLAPEPLLSKGIAATLTVVLITYLGWDMVWSLVQGWRVLAEEVKEATSFDEIQAAGEKYGAVMGKNAARVFIMLTMATLGSTAHTLAAKLPTLPGAAKLALVGAGPGGFRLAAVGQVEAVAVSSGGVVTIDLESGVVAMTARGTSAAAPGAVGTGGHEHHIATNKWWDSTSQGGPWSPKFQKLFDRAGMSLDDAENTIRVPGHKGPHPQEYHEEIFERLRSALGKCRSHQQCRESLVGELRVLARELSTSGTPLNHLVTRN